MKNDKRPKRFGWAPGGYINRCSDCGDQFIGDKRAIMCADCAYGKPDPAPKTPDPVASPNLAIEALKAVKHWASARCPVHEEKPDPCPLCGATVDGKGLDGVCKALKATIPRHILDQINAAIARGDKNAA